MFNAEKPSLEELPSSAQLVKSTIIAAVSAVVILVTVVLPAEYGIDPTGVGKALGLAEMGEIKTQLAEEAEADSPVQLVDWSISSGKGGTAKGAVSLLVNGQAVEAMAEGNGPVNALDAAMRKALNALMDIREEYKLPRVCTG